MGDPFPGLTLFLGPQSGHALAINLAVRNQRPAMIRAGLAAYPTRLASPALRGLADPNRTLAERRDAFLALSGEMPAFYSALNFLGSPNKGFRRSELFPDAAIQLGLLAEVAGEASFRVILAPDALPDLFLAVESEEIAEQIRDKSWEQLYEVNWAELVTELRDALPASEVIVLTHAGLALGGALLGARLFGSAADVVEPRFFLREALNVTGQAVLDRMGEGTPTDAVARDLYRSFARRVDDAACREALGMDRLTRKLLMQRFDEDLVEIAAMDSVEVI